MRARLAITVSIAVFALAIATQALAADGPPSQTAPADGATFTAGDTLVFQAQVGTAVTPTPPTDVVFFISRQADPMAAPIDQLVSSTPSGGDANTSIYTASPTDDKSWPGKPGVYHWEAASEDCSVVGTTPPHCYSPSGTVQSFTINSKPASSVKSPDDLDTFLGKHPKHRTHHRKVKFTFSSNVSGSKFQCLYANGWAGCDSPHVFRDLRPGRYQFQVRAITHGVKDSSPASWTFHVLH
jgi:hypothetical protein